MRHLPRVFPAANRQQLAIAGETVQQIPIVLEIVDRFGDEGTGDGNPVLGRRPIHPREEGMKRASGTRFKTAIRRLLVSLSSPTSSSSRGKRALCSRWVN